MDSETTLKNSGADPKWRNVSKPWDPTVHKCSGSRTDTMPSPFPPVAVMAEKEKRKTDRPTEKQATNSNVVDVFFEFTI